MACNCGRNSTSLVQLVAGSEFLDLVTYPGCTTAYSGTPRSLFVVGRGTVNERLFPGWNAGEAGVYASQQNAPLEMVNAYRLCEAAVLANPD